MLLQPCDWVEHDVQGKYVVDVFGRTDKQKVACLRITGFKPYFYVSSKQQPSTAQVYEQANKTWEIKFGPRKGQRDYAYKLSKKIFEYLVPELTKVQKYDVMQGFQELKLIDVWKVTCGSQAIFQAAKSVWKSLPQYESNLHPFLRLFHERHLGPASPIRVENAEFTDIPLDENDEPLYRVDEFYTCDYMDIYPAEAQIPLLVASYDLEMYSESGLFPQATKDPIIQIGVSYRWTHKLLEPALRVVYVLGEVSPSEDKSIEFVSCATEYELLTEFMEDIRERNPDIMCGYNIFNFDDGYIEGRCQKLGITFDISRKQAEFGEKSFETKKFELASGKYDLRFMCLRGRLGIDLLLNMRREHNLSSYKLDDVASVFLRGKVTGYINNQIKTKSTRGLYNGNYVRFETVGNTSNSLYEGKKFEVYDVQKDSFRVKTDEPLFEGEDVNYIEWTFSKDDVDHLLLFELHAHGGPEGRAKIAKYCIQDCDLVLTLMAKLDTIVNARGMADVCKVPMDYVLQRGQGIKIFSAVLYYASQRNQIISLQESLDEDTGYEGAIVLPPKIGMYLEQPISVLDFNSLYPTNMIAYNISPDTLVSVRVFNEHGQKVGQEGYEKKEFDRLVEAGYVLDEIEYDNKETGGKTICTYVQKNPNNPMTEGVLPKTLDILLKKRKEFKEKMEDLQYDEAQRSVFNGLQLAYKVVANSVYGQTGSRTSPIRKLCVAASTTAAGRKMLHFAKDIVETKYGATVIYGDSVASYTPVTIRTQTGIDICSIEELGQRGEWKPMVDSEKEYCELEGIESWTESGWTPLHRIIRHALAPHKKMIRVLTHNGLVDVTDDHSLLRPDGTEVSPKTLEIGDELMHHMYPKPIENSTRHSTEEARIAGFFCGDGSCGFYKCPSGNKASWALNNANIELLEQYRVICQRVFPEFIWNILPTLISSNVFKLVPNGQGVQSFVVSYREQAYVQQRKQVPDWVMNGPREIRKAFWDGFYDADGDKDMNGYTRIDQKHQTTCAQLVWLGSSLGYNVSINTRNDKPAICRLTFTNYTQRKPSNQIKKIHEIEYSGYVYDLTTSNHHFQAGVGTMIVHNTDSIFIQFPTKELVESIRLGIEAGKEISSLSRRPYKIAYEKTFYPFILFCRKRYVGMMYEENPNAKPKRKEMGIPLRRRDNAPIVKDIYGGALDIILKERNILKAQKFVNQKLLDVLENRIPLEKFIISKSLRDDYKNPEQIAHRVLADRMAKRDPGTAPKVGERIPYIYVAENSKAAKQGDQIEELSYVRKHNLHPDAVFYITNQIQNPVAQLFALCIEQLDGYLSPKQSYEKLMKQMMEKYNEDEEEATKAVLDKKADQLESIMFLGSRTLANIIRKNTRGPMDLFVQKK
jgi:DNA polymerase elongation subunit (family B)